VNESKGWLLAGGKLYSTADGGRTWVSVNQPIASYPGGDLANFRFAESGGTGWALGGEYRSILPTDETGPSDRNARPGSKDQGLASVLFVTHNFGKTWQKEHLP
ncbi:MAG: hypothetical protein ACREDR_18415, partial [Blastocatellia bacterium]